MQSLDLVASAFFYYLLATGLIDFSTWVTRYRALRRLQRDGLLYLALMREAFQKSD